MKTSCKLAERWISVKVDGETLPDDLAGRLDEHLRACPACSRLLETERKRAALLGSVLGGDERAEGLLKESILRSAAAVKVGRGEVGRGEDIVQPRSGSGALRSLMTVRRLGLAAAAALLVGLAGWWMIPSPTPSSSPQGPWKLSFDSEQWDVDPVTSRDGTRMGRTERRVHDIFLVPGNPKAGADEDRAKDVLLDTERVNTRYIKLTGYSYH